MTLNPPSSDYAIQRVVNPESPAQVAEVLAVAAQDHEAVRIVGGNGAAMLGNPLRQVAITLSTSRLNRILAYQPTDMTLSVEAGARLSDVAQALSEHGQMLPVEAADPSKATIGGLIATSLTGPRRYGGGTLRDVLIGISVAYPDGTVGKAGGMVVKNVSGFDMMRIHHGAMGTLGVIVSANFKVLPLPRAEFTVISRLPDFASAMAVADGMRSPSIRPVSLLLGRLDGGWELAARYEGRNSGLRAVRDRLAHLPLHDAVFHADAGSSDYWSAVMDGRRMDDPTEFRLRLSVPSASVPGIVPSLIETAEAGHTITRLEVEPGLGVVTMSIAVRDAATAQSCRSLVNHLRAEQSTGAVTVLAAPNGIKQGMEVWGLEPQTIDIMRALKHEFDPDGILNPGCFIGSI